MDVTNCIRKKMVFKTKQNTDIAVINDIQFKIKILKTGEIKTVPIKDLFYKDEWMSGFSLDDIRVIAKAYAQFEWYRDKTKINQEVKRLGNDFD